MWLTGQWWVVMQVQWDRNMRRLIVAEADVQEGSTPLKDLFDQIASGQSKIGIGQLKVKALPSLPAPLFRRGRRGCCMLLTPRGGRAHVIIQHRFSSFFFFIGRAHHLLGFFSALSRHRDCPQAPASLLELVSHT